MKKGIWFLVGSVVFLVLVAVSGKNLMSESQPIQETTAVEIELTEEEQELLEKEEIAKKEDQKRKEEEALRKSYATKVPYVGMDEKYIDCTIVCVHDSYDSETYKVSGKNIYRHKYIWYASNGYDVPLIVICKNGEVIDVYKYYADTYWDSNGYPCFDNKRSTYKSYSSSSNKNYYDAYDVNEYDDPDDFADEWAEEFGDGDYEYGYEDAYDYWEDNYTYKSSKKDYYDKYDVYDYDDPDEFAEEWEDEFDDYDEAYDYWEENYKILRKRSTL